MAVSAMGEFTRSTSANDFVRRIMNRDAPEQGGILTGDNPAEFNTNDPIRLWVIQVVIIIAMTQFLSLIFGKMRQPRVIAEVIGGVLLGPTVMGRIPGFRENIFPTESMPYLNLTATIGLVLFLFLVGLEIDTGMMKKNVRSAVAVSIAGLALPLGLGAALGVGVYRQFIDPTVNFGYFVLFTAVAVGITAFPVLCRILTELKLLDTTVGVVVLSAGVGNDVVGWILLALTVALVNASTGLTALYVLLCSVGFVIFLLFPVKWAYLWLCRRTGSLEQGSPTALTMTVTLLIVFASAFFTDVIGVHAIFGGFLAGLIIPHENGFAISLVEKIEDLVSILLLPVYFTLSGLKTNLGLLDDGITWGYTILICVVAFSSKFLACGAAGYATGFNWRESGAIGALMSCKGLVELIVLNVGLQAGILDTRVFSMFVIHAIILTFLTTPLTLVFYPSKYRTHANQTNKDVAGSDPEMPTLHRRSTSDQEVKSRFAVVLDKIEQLPAAMTLSQLLYPSASASNTSIDKSSEKMPEKPRISIDALRLIELTNRTSAVLKSTEASSLLQTDPLISIFRTFGQLNKFVISAALSVISLDEFPAAISRHVSDSATDMVILPWSRGSAVAPADEEDGLKSGGAWNPFDGIFNKSSTSHVQEQTSSVVYSEFIRRVFLSCPADVGLFVDRGTNMSDGQQLFLPFFGGPDDRLALSFLVQLCMNPNVNAQVVWITKSDTSLSRTSTGSEDIKPATGQHQTLAAADTVYGMHNTETRLASNTADSIAWDKYAGTSQTHSGDILSALSRITFTKRESSEPLHCVLEDISLHSSSVIVVTGRSRRLAAENLAPELAKIISEKGSYTGSSVSKTLGNVGAAVVAGGSAASLLVVQAATPEWK